MKLTTAKIRSPNLKPGRYHDGKGLYLIVSKGGTKSWTLRLTIDGRQREIGLGSARKIGLKTARQAAAAKRSHVDNAIDPTAQVPTLREAMHIVYDLHSPHWTSPKYARQWRQSLENHAMTLMDIEVDRLTTAHVLSILQPKWNANPNLARNLRQRLKLIFAWVVAQGHLEINPASDTLDGILPKRRPATIHHHAVPYNDAPEAFRSLEEIELSGAQPARFAIITATRSTEARAARWSEIDVDDRLWSIPATRTKMRRPHRIPLSDAALTILDEARGHDHLVFPAPRSDQPVDDAAPRRALKAAGLTTTLHGFRATFRSWALDNGADWATSEAALGHALGDAIIQAYVRTDLLEQRRSLMADWSEFLTT